LDINNVVFEYFNPIFIALEYLFEAVLLVGHLSNIHLERKVIHCVELRIFLSTGYYNHC